MKAPNVTKGPWLPMQPLGKSYSDHGYRAVAHIQRASPITIYAERDNLVVEGKGCVFGDVEADAKMLAAAPMLAEAGAAALAELRNTIQEFGGCDHAVNICFCSMVHAADSLQAALLSAGYTEE